MKLASIISLSAVAVSGLANEFEPAEFNVTEALIKNGVNISAIPELQGLVQRSSPNACSIAVSLPCHDSTLCSAADKAKVQSSQFHIRKQQRTISRISRLRGVHKRLLGCSARHRQPLLYLQTGQCPTSLSARSAVPPYAMPICYQGRRPCRLSWILQHRGWHHSGPGEDG